MRMRINYRRFLRLVAKDRSLNLVKVVDLISRAAKHERPKFAPQQPLVMFEILHSLTPPKPKKSAIHVLNQLYPEIYRGHSTAWISPSSK